MTSRGGSGNVDHAKLRELALAAKNGPARLLIDDLDKAFIAAASPSAVLELLDEIEALRDHLRVSDELNDALGDVNELSVKLSAITAARDEACEQLEELGHIHLALGREETTHFFERLDALRKVGR